jgi:hypothetical protein
MKCDKYTGETPWDVFIAHFETVAEYNHWREDEALAQLKGALRGVAAHVLLMNNKMQFTLKSLKEVLRQRFGDTQQSSRYRMELRKRRRQAGESLQSLYSDISRLAMLAHPGGDDELHQRLAVEAFIDSLNDHHLEEQLANTFPSTLEEAYSMALRIEANRRINIVSEEQIATPKRKDRLIYAVTTDDLDESNTGNDSKEKVKGWNVKGKKSKTHNINAISTSQQQASFFRI